MLKVPSFFGDIPREEIEKFNSALENYEKYITTFQERERVEDKDRGMVRGPRLKSYSVTRVKQ